MKLNFALSGKVYDMLKWIALILLPALGTFYFAMASAWSLPFANEIVGTIAAIDTFLAVLLGLSQSNSKELNAKMSNVFNMETMISVFWVMSDATYDFLKWVAQIVLPALATLYFALSQIWGLPMTEQIVATIMALDGLLGMLLQLSTSQFNKRAAYICLSDE
jgi:Putative phage holin Dp-1